MKLTSCGLEQNISPHHHLPREPGSPDSAPALGTTGGKHELQPRMPPNLHKDSKGGRQGVYKAYAVNPGEGSFSETAGIRPKDDPGSLGS